MPPLSAGRDQRGRPQTYKFAKRARLGRSLPNRAAIDRSYWTIATFGLTLHALLVVALTLVRDPQRAGISAFYLVPLLTLANATFP